LFALVHVVGKNIRFLHVTPRSIWLSFAGGVSLSYVFVHLLPELGARQRETSEHLDAGREGPAGVILYVAALAGLIAFHALEHLVRNNRRKAARGASGSLFWVHLASYAVYSVLIGYLLVHQQERELGELATYAFAMALHFLINDQGLREHHGTTYDRQGRWILAASPLVGWTAGILIELSPLAISIAFAFLAGSIVLIVLKEELPEDRESRFGASALGAATFAIVLVLAR
jgi:zinc transporter ZupT